MLDPRDPVFERGRELKARIHRDSFPDSTGGGSIKAVQAQLGHKSEQSTHRYSHLGAGAQKRLVEALAPETAPHAKARGGHVNGESTGTQKSSLAEAHVNLEST
ncbi:MAG TPA: hypothetical protein VF294_16875, partial [Polyangiaceae bacterium]